MIRHPRDLARAVLPRPVRRLARAAFGWRWFRGNYATWAAARACTTGYADDVIVRRVLDATLAVRAGRAVFERDSVLFHEAVPEPGLVAALAEVAASVRDRPVRVVDFGGALGTTYWRHHLVLAGLGDWSWRVVEQPGFVAAGREHLSPGPVEFHSSIPEAEADGPADVLLASTVIQYLEFPHATLADWAAGGRSWLLLNNLPLHSLGPDRICVQHVPPEIYPATYPVWFFNRDRFLASIPVTYRIHRDFASEAVWPVGWREYRSTGLLLRRCR